MIIPDNIKMFEIYNPYPNHEVVDYYCSIICEALRDSGYRVSYVEQLVKANENKDKGILVVKVSDASIAKSSKYGFVMTWIQGVAPEEKWLISKSLLKFLNALRREIVGLWDSDFNIYCSERMKSHYIKRYIVHAKHDFIMPCFNEEIDLDLIKEKDYSKNVFSYSGGLDRWQCFEQTVQIYKQIEDVVPNVFFKIFARDQKLAIEICDRYKVKHYSVDYVSQEQLKEEYKTVKFGFCIRDDIEINRVATPTKLSGYVANGIIPIYSKCVDGFAKQSKGCKYALCVDDSDFLEQIENLCSTKPCNNQIAKEFAKCYGDYYSAEYYIKKFLAACK